MKHANIVIPKGCQCSNVEIGSYANQVELPTPPHMLALGSIGCLTFNPTTCVDRCISDRVQALWDKGIITTGCCCGHNKVDGYIGVFERSVSGQPTPVADTLTQAARDVLAERRRQVEQEGYRPASDDGYVNDEIAAYATFYAMPPAARDWPAAETGYGETWGEAIIPADWTAPKPGDRRRELVKAGALILAEIERLDRAATQEGGGKE